MADCMLCNNETCVVVNIGFQATPVCDRCCLAITRQTVNSLVVDEFTRYAEPHTEIRSKHAKGE